MKKRLTARERDLMILIRRHSYWAIPTVRELARLMGVSSPATIQQHLSSLRQKGWLDAR